MVARTQSKTPSNKAEVRGIIIAIVLVVSFLVYVARNHVPNVPSGASDGFITKNADMQDFTVPHHVMAIALDNNGSKLAFQMGGKTILRDVTTGQEKEIADASNERAQWMQFTPDGKTLSYYTDTRYEGFYHLDTKDPSVISSVNLSSYQSTDDMAWAPDSKTLAFSTVSLYETITLRGYGLQRDLVSYRTREEGEHPAKSIAWSPDGRFIANTYEIVGGTHYAPQHGITIRDASTGVRLNRWDLPRYNAQGPLYFLNNGNIVVQDARQGLVYSRQGKLQFKCACAKPMMVDPSETPVVASGNGNLLLAWNDEGAFRYYSPNGKVLKEEKLDLGQINCLYATPRRPSICLSYDGRWVAIGATTYDGKVGNHVVIKRTPLP